MKSHRDHYKAKYPGGDVAHDGDVLHVRCKDGFDRVRVEKTGAGVLKDVSQEHGCVDDHSGAPARVLGKDGRWSERQVWVPKGEGADGSFVPLSKCIYSPGARCYVLREEPPKQG